MTLLTKLHLDELCLEDRIQLAQELWDNIGEAAPAIPLSEPQQRELQRRMDDHARNPDAVVPWEQVKAAAIARLGS